MALVCSLMVYKRQMVAELSLRKEKRKKKKKEKVGLFFFFYQYRINISPRHSGSPTLTNTPLWQVPFPISVFARSVTLFKNLQLLCDFLLKRPELKVPLWDSCQITFVAGSNLFINKILQGNSFTWEGQSCQISLAGCSRWCWCRWEAGRSGV